MDRATLHALRVVNNEVVSGHLHRLACERHLRDLEKQNTEEFPYYYDEEEAERIINFAETLTIAEGDNPKPVRLIEEQCFDLGVTFGWKNTSNDKRRFRRRYKSMARQQGKTFENGIMGTYISGFGSYRYGKLFTAATKKRQAKVAWEEMQKFIKIDPELSELFDIKEYKSLIYAKLTNCTIEALSKEGGLDEGFRSIFTSLDEIHQHKDNKIYKNLYNGQRNVAEALISMITTRGDKLNSFCYEMDKYCINILKGIVKAEDFFVDIYTLDDDDDIFDEKNWVKANPLTGKSEEGIEQLRIEAQTAKDMGGSDLRDFITKALNMWAYNTDDNFVDIEKFNACGCDKTLEDFKGRSCNVGLDLSSGGDLTTYVLEFEDGENIFWHSHSYMPRGRLNEHVETDLAPYDIWAEKGLITVTGGENDFKNDYKFIIKELRDIKERYDLKFKGIGVDPHNADGIMAELESFGCPVVIVTQSAKSLNDSTVDVQLLVKGKKVGYNKEDELLKYSFANAAIVRNSFGEIKVDKKPRQHYKRIDPVDACIDAHYLTIKNLSEGYSQNEVMEEYLKTMGW